MAAIRSALLLISSTAFLAVTTISRAQDTLSPESGAVVAELADALSAAGDDAVARYAAFGSLAAAFVSAAASDDSVPSGQAIADTALAAGAQVQMMREGLLALDPVQDSPDAAAVSLASFLAAAALASPFSPPTSAELYALSDRLDRANAGGMSLAGILRDVRPDALDRVADLLKAVKAALGARDLASDPEADRARIVRDFIDMVPASAAPILTGPAVAAFADLQDWNGRMWDGATHGMDLVSEAMETGELDNDAYAALSAEIEDLARKGPWDSDTAAEALKKFAESLPFVGGLLKALWPEDTVDECTVIDCDCGGITDWGILNGAMRDQCRATENALRAECAASGMVEGSCDPIAQGPGASPLG
ncbi:MAG: hypothetical protein H3C33_07100 [Rhodocyclaceae bacterium]|nr:hypothetical protein [Rhodocyclaceae bacterium]